MLCYHVLAGFICFLEIFLAQQLWNRTTHLYIVNPWTTELNNWLWSIKCLCLSIKLFIYPYINSSISLSIYLSFVCLLASNMQHLPASLPCLNACLTFPPSHLSGATFPLASSLSPLSIQYVGGRLILLARVLGLQRDTKYREWEDLPFLFILLPSVLTSSRCS